MDNTQKEKFLLGARAWGEETERVAGVSRFCVAAASAGATGRASGVSQ